MLLAAGAQPVGLYVHIPFCKSICTYCAFAKQEYDSKASGFWLHSLEAEFALRSRETWGERPQVDTIFLGGGTPSALSEHEWEQLGALIHRYFDPVPGGEITSEANPESVLPEKLAVMRRAGVNRLSLGAQSFLPEELSLLGRAHDRTAVKTAVEAAREAGFENISIDLMYGLPGQTPENWERTLDQALELPLTHLSAYCLGLEPGTPLAEGVQSGQVARPGDDSARDQYERLLVRCREAGLEPYELSNFSRRGFQCRHNLKYWERRDFLAAGPSAHATCSGYRWANPAPLHQWGSAYEQGAAPALRPVPQETACFEWVFLNLRLAGGFLLSRYQEEWGESFLGRYRQTVESLVSQGLLEMDGERVRLPEAAWFLSDAVFSEFAP